MSTSGGQCGPCCSILPTGTITTGLLVRASSSSSRHISWKKIFLAVPCGGSYEPKYIAGRDHTKRLNTIGPPMPRTVSRLRREKDEVVAQNGVVTAKQPAAALA